MPKFLTNQVQSVLCLLLLGFAIIKHADSASHLHHAPVWGYVAGVIMPANWSTYAPWHCDGWSQSPVNIQTGSTHYYSWLKAVSYTENTTLRSMGTDRLENDGHKVVLTPGHTIRYSVGPNDCFEVLHIHWHWGADNSEGAEHEIDGKRYPMEGHVVSWNCHAYSSISEAINKAGGLAVLGFLYEIVPESQKNDVLENISQKFTDIAKAPAYHDAVNVTFPSIDFLGLVPSNLWSYYRYMGSLTTPDCTENVLWTVLTSKARITEAQIARFRAMKYPDNSPFQNNHRPTQPLNRQQNGVAYRVILRASSERGVQPMSALLFMVTLFIWQISTRI